MIFLKIICKLTIKIFHSRNEISALLTLSLLIENTLFHLIKDKHTIINFTEI